MRDFSSPPPNNLRLAGFIDIYWAFLIFLTSFFPSFQIPFYFFFLRTPSLLRLLFGRQKGVGRGKAGIRLRIERGVPGGEGEERMGGSFA